MPLYTVTTEAGTLSRETRSKLAGDLTAFHSEYSGVPKNWVHVAFQEYPAACGYGRRGRSNSSAHAANPDWPVAGI
jgi:phenylpyruvate tautomerase PptA (4-oxalocrotonate tautomerase family)